MRRALLLVTLAALAPAGAVQAKEKPPRVVRAPGYVPKDPAAARRLARQDEAVRLINLAETRTHNRYAECKPVVGQAPLVLSDADPDPALVAQIAALRRPATEEDLAQEAALEGRPDGHAGTIYRRYTRVLHPSGGQLLEVSIRQGGLFSVTPPPAVCVDRSLRELRRLAAKAPKPVRDLVQRYARQSRMQQSAVSAAPTDGVFVFSFDPDGRGGGGGGGDAADFAKHGDFGSSSISGTGLGTVQGTSRLTGVVPDGVASITFQAPKVLPRGRDFKPLVFKRAYERTVAVKDNAVSLVVPRPADAAIGITQLWRDATGTVVNTVNPLDGRRGGT